MPPVYKCIYAKHTLDNDKAHEVHKAHEAHEAHESNILKNSFKYVPNVIDSDLCKIIYNLLDESMMKYHTYVGNFNRIMNPKRKTYALVPERLFYRYKGKNLKIVNHPLLEKVMELLKPYIDPCFQYDSVIFNGYCYNNIDNISPHIDDEKFLQSGNYPVMSTDESVVCTITILNNPMHFMTYKFSDPYDNTNGYKVDPKNGSILYQGAILHEVEKKYVKELSDIVGRYSITLRKLCNSCDHKGNKDYCSKISCPSNYGPSNYVYYNNHDCL